MIRRYKIVLNPQPKPDPRPIINSNLTKSSNYLSYDNSSTYSGLVDENNVFNYLSNPNNLKIVSSFIKYLTDNVKKEAVQFLYTQANKIYPILNDYYKNKTVLNKEPSKSLLHETLLGTETTYYQDTSFDYKTKIRNNKKNLRKLIQFKTGDTAVQTDIISSSNADNPAKFQSTGEKFEIEESAKDFFENYYINIEINKTQAPVLTTDYSQYLADCKRGGVVLRNCFVYLNTKVDPFEYWGNGATYGGDGIFRIINDRVSKFGNQGIINQINSSGSFVGVAIASSPKPTGFTSLTITAK